MHGINVGFVNRADLDQQFTGLVNGGVAPGCGAREHNVVGHQQRFLFRLVCGRRGVVTLAACRRLGGRCSCGGFALAANQVHNLVVARGSHEVVHGHVYSRRCGCLRAVKQVLMADQQVVGIGEIVDRGVHHAYIIAVACVFDLVAQHRGTHGG